MPKFKIGDLFRYTEAYPLLVGVDLLGLSQFYQPKINSTGIILSKPIKKEFVMVYVDGRFGQLYIDAIKKI